MDASGCTKVPDLEDAQEDRKSSFGSSDDEYSSSSLEDLPNDYREDFALFVEEAKRWYENETKNAHNTETVRVRNVQARKVEEKNISWWKKFLLSFWKKNDNNNGNSSRENKEPLGNRSGLWNV